MNGLAICAGIGGLELGVQLAMAGRYRTVGYVEWEAYAAAVLVARMEEQALDPAPIWDDLTTFDGSRWRDMVEIVTAGIPCQPFSVAGERRGIHDPRWLWPDLWRVVNECGARSIFLENTPGIRKAALPLILADLAESGWSAEWGLLGASDVGAPHQRNRFFLLAHASGAAVGEQPRRSSWASGEGEAATGHAGDTLADTNGGRRQQLRLGSVHNGLGETLGHDADGQSGEELADSHLEGLEGPEPEERYVMPAGSGRFPPGPESDGWWDGTWNGPQPAVRRDSPRAAYRMDRLRCLGNAVVPLQAALAFRQLSARFRR